MACLPDHPSPEPRRSGGGASAARGPAQPRPGDGPSVVQAAGGQVARPEPGPGGAGPRHVGSAAAGGVRIGGVRIGGDRIGGDGAGQSGVDDPYRAPAGRWRPRWLLLLGLCAYSAAVWWGLLQIGAALASMLAPGATPTGG